MLARGGETVRVALKPTETGHLLRCSMILGLAPGLSGTLELTAAGASNQQNQSTSSRGGRSAIARPPPPRRLPIVSFSVFQNFASMRSLLGSRRRPLGGPGVAAEIRCHYVLRRPRTKSHSTPATNVGLPIR
jgi:hypothetical protein